MIRFWITRDEEGILCLHYKYPIKHRGSYDEYGYREGYFEKTHQSCMYLDSDLFPQVTWDNSPQAIYLSLDEDNVLTKVKERISKMKSLHSDFAKIIEEDFWKLVF